MAPTQPKSFSIAIIGGGLAGLSLARGLAVRGVESQVFEAAKEFAEIGAGLSFARNAIDALRYIDLACVAALQQRCHDVSAQKDVYMTYRDGTADDAAPVTTLYCHGSGQQAVHRTLIVKDMAALMPKGSFHMGKKLESVTKLPSGGFRLGFQDQSMVSADVVIAADGIKSVLRPFLLGAGHPDAYPKYSGEFGYRGLVPMEDAINVLGESFAKNGNVLMGDGALTTTYPVEKGSMLNIVAAREQATWDSAEWVVSADEDAVAAEFAGYGAKMRQVVSLLRKPQKWSLWHHPATPTFYSGRLALLGDAAHASTPHQGAGASQAFEDALVLCSLLAHDSVQTLGDVEHALAAYDAVRRPRSLQVVKTSRENGEVCMMRGAETGKDLNKIRANLDERFKWIWYGDLQKQVDKALHVLVERQGNTAVQETSALPCLHNAPGQREAIAV